MTGRATVSGRALVLAGEVLLILGVTSVQLGAAPGPTIAFLKPADGATLADESALIEVSYAGDPESPILRVEVFVDGKRQFEYRSPGGEPRGTRSFSWELKPVAAGEHILRAQATDSAGRVASATVSVNVEAPVDRDPRQRWLRRLRPEPPAMAVPEIPQGYRGQIPPQFFGEGGQLWGPTIPPRRRGGGGPTYPGPTSQLWFPTNPPMPIGGGARVWHDFRTLPEGDGQMELIIPDGQGGERTIIIPRGRELQDVWPRILPEGGALEFRMPDGRGRGTIRILPRIEPKEPKPPEEEPKGKDEDKEK